MKNLLASTSVIVLALFLSGCATSTSTSMKMALQNDTDRLTDASKPIFLMTVTIKNTYKTSYQPRLRVVNVEKLDAKDSSEEINFTIDEKAMNETDSLPEGNSYLIRMELPPGSYEIRGLTSMAHSFPIGFTDYFAPLHSPLDSRGSGVFYLGHVAATVRERQGSEFRAGPSDPIINSLAGGAFGGTFDIEISDELSIDEKLFRAKFPALRGVEIKKAVLPPFDRAKAQQWWETH